MINVPTTLTSTLPALKSTSVLDIATNPIGSFLNHRKDMAKINYEIEKLEYQTQIIIKNIDAQLTKALDENQKNYKKEMKRLGGINKSLKHNNKRQDELLVNISRLTDKLINSNASLDEKILISNTITTFHQSLNSLGIQNIQHIDAMSNFNPNQKAISSQR